MEIHSDKEKSNFTLTVSREELRRIGDAVGKIPIHNNNERKMYEQIYEEFK